MRHFFIKEKYLQVFRGFFKVLFWDRSYTRGIVASRLVAKSFDFKYNIQCDDTIALEEQIPKKLLYTSNSQ